MPEQAKPNELFSKIAARDESAFAQFYELLSPHIMGIIRKAITDSEAAEEILVNIFVRLWGEAKRLSAGQSSPDAWLALRARALAADQARNVRNKRPAAAARLDSLPANSKWLPGTKAAALLDDKRALLSKFLRQLPASQARLLELAIVLGQTEKEIAHELGQTEGKIRTDLRAAFRFMRHRTQTVVGAWTAVI